MSHGLSESLNWSTVWTWALLTEITAEEMGREKAKGVGRAVWGLLHLRSPQPCVWARARPGVICKCQQKRPPTGKNEDRGREPEKEK